MFSYDKELSAAVEEVDRYDLIDTLIKCWDKKIYDPCGTMEYVQQEFPTLEDAIDLFGIDEWIIYLAERYNVTFIEETSYHMVNPRYIRRQKK